MFYSVADVRFPDYFFERTLGKESSAMFS